MRWCSPGAGGAPPSPSSRAPSSALALAPVNAWPVLFVTFPVAGLADRRRVRRPARRRVDARPPRAGGSASAISSPASTGSAMPSWSMPRPSRWLLPFAVARPAGLPGALHGARRSRWRGCCGCAGRCAFSRSRVALTIAEWLRGHLLTGFPWNAFGYALTEPLVLAQSAVAGRPLGADVPGGLAVLRSPAVLADERARHAAAVAAAARSRVIVLARLAAYGAVRLAAHADELRRRREAAHHAAQSAAGREVQLRRQAAGDGALSRAVRSRHRSGARPACATSRT